MDEHKQSPEAFAWEYDKTIPEGDVVDLTPSRGTMRRIEVRSGIGQICIEETVRNVVAGDVLAQIYNMPCTARADFGDLQLIISDTDPL